MPTHHSLTDVEFENQFSNGTIDPTLFSHEAHLRIAWIHLGKYGVKQAQRNITAQIKAFATMHGDAQKYHETLTIAAVRVVHHFMKRSTASAFEDFIVSFPELTDNFTGLVKRHYSTDMFTSLEAKENYIAPDLLSFDD